MTIPKKIQWVILSLVLAANLMAVPGWTSEIETQLIIVTDVSPSMEHTDIKARDRIAGQKVLLYQMQFDENLQVGLVHFTDQIEKTRKIEHLPTNTRELDTIVGEFHPTVGKLGKGTNLAKALRRSRELFAVARDPAVKRRVILLMSDGDFDKAPQLIKGWRNGGEGKEIWQEIQKLKKQNVVLYTIPITPKIYNVEPTGNAKQRQDTLRRWNAGHRLLDQMAKQTGGRSFVRKPGVVDFADVYANVIRQKLVKGAVNAQRNKDHRPIILPIHKTITFFGRDLKEITLANGTRIRLGRQPFDRVLKDLGTEMSWRPLGEWGLAIFRRPKNLKDEKRFAAWNGLWDIRVGPVGKVDEVQVVAFTDLKIRWAPSPGLNYWQNENVEFGVRLESRYLNPRQAEGFLEDVKVRIQLLDDSRNVVSNFKVTPRSRTDFTAKINFDRSGRFAMLVTVLGRVKGVDHEIYRVEREIEVQANAPVALKGEVVGDHGRQVVFAPELDEVKSVHPKERVIVQVVISQPGWKVTGSQPEQHPAFNPTGGDAQQHSFEVHQSDRVQPITMTVQAKSENPEEPERQFTVQSPPIRVEDGNSEMTARLVGSVDPKRKLFVGEETETGYRIRVRFDGVPRHLIENEDTCFVTIQNQSLFEEPKSVLARQTAVEPIADTDNGWQATYELQIRHGQLTEPGWYAYKFADPVAGLKVVGKRSFEVAPAPTWLSIGKSIDKLRSQQIGSARVPAHEVLTTELRLDPGWEFVGNPNVTLCYRSTESSRDAVKGQESIGGADLERVSNDLARGKLGPLQLIRREVYPVAKLTIRRTGEPKIHNINVRLSQSFHIVKPEIQVNVAFDWSEKSPVFAHQPRWLNATFTVSGGDPDERSQVVKKVERALADNNLHQVFHCRVDGQNLPTLPVDVAKSKQTITRGDPLIGDVTIMRRFHVVFSRTGNVRIVTHKEGLPLHEVEPHEFLCSPSPFYVVLRQPEVNDAPLWDTRVRRIDTDPISVLPGATLTIEAKPWGSEVADFGTIRVIWTTISESGKHRLRELEVQEHPDGVSQFFASQKGVPGIERVYCEVISEKTRRILARFGPVQLDGNVSWTVNPIRRPPDLVPADATGWIEEIKLQVLSRGMDTAWYDLSKLKFILDVRHLTDGKLNGEFVDYRFEAVQKNDIETPGSSTREFFLSRWIPVGAKRPEPRKGSHFKMTLRIFAGDSQLKQEELFDVRVSDRAIRMNVIDPNRPNRPFAGQLPRPGAIEVSARLDSHVVSELNLGTEDPIIAVIDGEGRSFEADEVQAGVSRFQLPAGKYNVVARATPQLPGNGTEFLGFYLEDRVPISVKASPPPWALYVLLVLIGLAFVAALIVRFTWCRHHPATNRFCQVRSKTQELQVSYPTARAVLEKLRPQANLAEKVWFTIRLLLMPYRTRIVKFIHREFGEEKAVWMELAIADLPTDRTISDRESDQRGLLVRELDQPENLRLSYSRTPDRSMEDHRSLKACYPSDIEWNEIAPNPYGRSEITVTFRWFLEQGESREAKASIVFGERDRGQSTGDGGGGDDGGPGGGWYDGGPDEGGYEETTDYSYGLTSEQSGQLTLDD